MTTRNKHRVALFIVLLAAALLRLHHLSTQDIWYDEACSIRIASQPLANVLPTIETTENTPPLYYLILWSWKQLIGSTSPIAMRLPSVISGVASVYALYTLARTISRRRAAALLSAAMLAVSPYHIWFSQESRAYALMVLLGLCATIVFLRWMREATRANSIVYAAISIALLYTHLYGGAVLLAHGIYLIVTQSSRGTRTLYRWSILMLTVAAAFAAYLPALHRWLTRVEHFWIPPNSLHDLIDSLFAYFGEREQAIAIACAAGTVVIVYRKRRFVRLLALLIACSTVLPVIASMIFYPLYLPRYGIVALPATIALIAIGLFRMIDRLKARWLAPCISACAVFAVAFAAPPAARPDFRPVAAYLAAKVQPGDTVALTPKDVTVEFDYHIIRSDISRKGFAHTLPFDRALRPGEHVWLTAEMNHVHDVSETITRSGFAIASQRIIGQFKVIELVAQPKNEGD